MPICEEKAVGKSMLILNNVNKKKENNVKND